VPSLRNTAGLCIRTIQADKTLLLRFNHLITTAVAVAVHQPPQQWHHCRFRHFPRPVSLSCKFTTMNSKISSGPISFTKSSSCLSDAVTPTLPASLYQVLRSSIFRFLPFRMFCSFSRLPFHLTAHQFCWAVTAMTSQEPYDLTTADAAQTFVTSFCVQGSACFEHSVLVAVS
jgi:hypothetical protein